MKKFKFNLETLIKVRKIKEDKEKKRYADLVKELSKANDDLTNLNQQVVNVYETHEKDLEQSRSIEFVKEGFSFLEALKDKIKLQKNLLLKRQESVSKQREILLGAVKQRKIIEKHKEKKFEEYKSNSRKQETRILDEITEIKKKKSE